MRNGLSVIQDKSQKFLAGLNILTRTEILVGYPDDSSLRQGQPPFGKNARQDDDLTNSAIGYIMETGAPEANIPARPHLVPGVQLAMKRLGDLWKQAAQAGLKGDTARMNRIYHAIGLTAQMSVRGKIQSGPFVPLSPRTLAARRARGRTGTKPLLDTGQLRNAVSYVIRRSQIRQINMGRVGSHI